MNSNVYDDVITAGIWSVVFIMIGLFGVGMWAISSTDAQVNADNSNISPTAPVSEVKEANAGTVTEELSKEESANEYQYDYSAGTDMDCADFDSWDEAQYYYENIADDNLDGDYDGIACESLQ